MASDLIEFRSVRGSGGKVHADAWIGHIANCGQRLGAAKVVASTKNEGTSVKSVWATVTCSRCLLTNGVKAGA